jgi:hypothetical protein
MERACYAISQSHAIREGLWTQLSGEKCGRDTKGGGKNLMQINLYVKAKLAGTDEGKILDDIHGICYVREGKPCAGKGMYLIVAQPLMNTKRSPEDSTPFHI